jgi:hypothetical protein
MPTVKPLRTRPAMSWPVFWQATWTEVPMSQKRQANIMESRRPILSESGPATAEPTTEPAARAEPMAPWMTPAGLSKNLMYWSVTTMADMDEISKPKLE